MAVPVSLKATLPPQREHGPSSRVSSLGNQVDDGPSGGTRSARGLARRRLGTGWHEGRRGTSLSFSSFLFLA